MMQEFPEQQKAVVMVDGVVCWQLCSNKNDQSLLTFITKQEATKYSKKLGFFGYKVEKIVRRFEIVWAIRYDLRYEYYLACWET